MDIDTLLKTLSDNKIRLYVEKGNLLYQCEKGALTAELKACIVSNKKQLTSLLAASANQQKVKQKITKAPEREHGAVLSFSQQRLWFLNEYENNNSTVYNVPWAVRLKGRLDVPVLNRAINKIIKRHDILRTVYKNIRGESFQAVIAHNYFEVAVVDIAQSQIGEHVQSHALHVFDLNNGPVIAVRLLKINGDDHILLFNMHHIATDAWSMNILMEELSALYSAFINHQASPLAPLSIQYADYAWWQRERFNSEAAAGLTDYWIQKLNNRIDLLQLPTDRLRAPVQTFRGLSLDFQFSRSLTEQLQHIAKKNNVTLFMVLLSLFKLQLYRYASQKDIIVGIPALNRPRVELESLIGFFSNTLVLRSLIEPAMTFEQLLQQVKKTTLEAYDNQDIPFEFLVELLNPERSLSFSPVFQTMFSLQNELHPDFTLPGIDVCPVIKEKAQTSKFDLSMLCSASATRLTATIEFSTDLFDISTITRFFRHFNTLATAAIDNSRQSVAALPLLTQEEYQSLLTDWNATDSHCAHNQTIPALFEQQVILTPDAAAVCFENKTLTYRELNSRSSQLAHRLLERGVCSGDFIGICLTPGLSMVVSLLSVLKAGLTCVPLNPHLPAPRFMFIAEFVGIRLFITQRSICKKIPLLAQHALCIDDKHLASLLNTTVAFDAVLSEHVAGNSAQAATALAGIHYKASASGKPECVMIPHKNAVHFLLELSQRLTMGSDDCYFSFSAFFDSGNIFEVFTALLNGSRLLIADYAALKPVAALATLIRQENIRVMHAPPSIWKRLLASHWQPDNTLTVICSGERLSMRLKTALLKLPAVVAVWNMYTVAEVCGASSMTAQHGATDPGVLGPPIKGVNYCILDACDQPAPVGVTGELCIGGPQLAKGYLNAPQLNADKFIHADSTVKRLFRTGDLCCRLADGSLRFINRRAYQVHVRGFLVDTAGIEEALLCNKAIRDAIVLVQADGNAKAQLVAYIEPEPEPEPAQNTISNTLDETALTQFLSTRLPNFMIPAHFVCLEAIPILPDGRVDRAALKAPDLLTLAAREYVPPTTATQRMLAEIWSQVLDVALDKISLSDTFFSLGGHSLKAVKLAFRIFETTGVQISVNAVFEFASLSALSACIDRKKQQQQLFKKTAKSESYERVII